MESNLYPVVSTNRGLRIHRATCKRFKPEQQVGDVTTRPDAADLATCCKPSYSEVVRQRSTHGAATADGERDAASARVAELVEQARTGPSTFEEAIAAVLGGADPEATADQLVANNAVPADVDEVIAAAPSYRPEPARAATPTPAPTGRTKRGERGATARAEAKRLGKRGPGRKVTADELDTYIATVRREHPTSTQSDELEFAYWVEKIAVSRPTWDAAWARVTASATK